MFDCLEEFEAYLDTKNEDYKYYDGNDKTILNPTVFNEICTGITKTDKKMLERWWYTLLKYYTLKNQNYLSLLSGEFIGHSFHNLQLHHALITKATIRGVKDDRKNLINHSYNVMMLPSVEHLSGQFSADNKGVCAEVLSNLYGLDEVSGWYKKFPLKSSLPNIFHELEGVA